MAVWAGTPVLTLPGTRPVSRVAASLLTAASANTLVIRCVLFVTYGVCAICYIRTDIQIWRERPNVFMYVCMYVSTHHVVCVFCYTWALTLTAYDPHSDFITER